MNRNIPISHRFRPFVLLSFAAALFAQPALAAAAQGIDIKARQYFLIDAQTGTVLDQKNGDEHMPPSSMSKLMTLYITFTNLKSGKLALTDELTVSQNAWKMGGAASG